MQFCQIINQGGFMKKFSIVLLLFMACIVPSFAQEGMWMLTQIGQLDLAKKGLQIPVESIYSPGTPALCNAVLQLGGGTASFVSPDGLIITNHHVAYTAVQRASSTSSDYLDNGFLAKDRASEIQAQGYQANLLTEMKDVTGDVLAAAKGISDPVEADRKVNARIAEMTSPYEKEGSDMQAVIVPMFNGKQYIQYLYKVFKDIRIVYVPPLSIGNYGGETDNWMWPRHTGDFSFLRVYVSPDGKGVEYNAANVPYKPRIWLKVAPAGNKEGDFNFIIGYPGFTTRYRSSTSVKWNMENNYPFAIKNFQEIIALLEELTKNDPAGKLKVASTEKGLANVMKNYEGKLEGMKKTGFLQKKLNFEKDFMKWADSNPETKAKYSDILSKEKAQYVVLEKTKDRDNVFGLLSGLSGTPLSVAIQEYYIVKEREKPESEREPGFSERNVDEFTEGLTYAYADYYEPVEKALMARTLTLAAALPSDQRITGLEYVYSNPSQTVTGFVDESFSRTRMKDADFAKGLLKKSSKEMEAMDDPIIQMAVHLYPMSQEIQKTSEVFAANVTALRKEYLDGLYAWKGTGMYPDANGTIRFTWGPVRGYRPADAVWYDPFTTLLGVVAKNTGVVPFNAPPELVSLYEKKDFGRWADPVLKDVPVAFLNQCDITGGNSGSPVMNAKGELIGVVFDGNYEAMISDWQYDYALQRAISVDIRYVLFITSKFGHAGYLLDEMGVAQ
jgi:hypothetical protein